MATKPAMDAAAAAARLTEEIARLTADRDKVELLAQADALLAERRGEVAAAESALAALRGQITEAEATLARLAADTKAERAVLVELGFEKQACEREIHNFGRVAETQSERFRDQLRALLPREPALTDAEAAARG